MTLSELLKSSPETLSAVTKAIEEANKGITDENKKINFVDLGEGNYTDVNKFNRLKTKYDELKNAENPFETKYNELVTSSTKSLEDERTKLTGVVKKLAVENAIGQLSVTDPLMKAGLKSLIDESKITVDDNYNITGGLTDQIDNIKQTYKNSFAEPINVSTGDTVPKSGQVGSVRKYTEAELDKMSIEEVMADLDNIVGQLGEIK